MFTKTKVFVNYILSSFVPLWVYKNLTITLMGIQLSTISKL